MAHASLFKSSRLAPIRLIPTPNLAATRTLLVNALDSGAGPATGLSGGSGPSYQLRFTMQHQNHDNWCWAAVSVSVSMFYLPTTGWTQCSVVAAETGDATCCTDGSSKTCNVPWGLDSALIRTNNLSSWNAGPLTAAEIQSELGAPRVICCRIGWLDGGGHFVSISGYQNDGTSEEVTVDDPWYGRSTVPLAVFLTAYQHTGTWTHSYYTQA